MENGVHNNAKDHSDRDACDRDNGVSCSEGEDKSTNASD